MVTSFYTDKELKKVGFKSFGKNVLLSKKASIYTPERITIGDNVRIDDFCILSGTITIKSFVHISAYCALYGHGGIEIGNYSGLSPRCTIFSASDDFSGDYMINSMLPIDTRNLISGFVKLGDYVQAGANSIIMPSVTIGEGSILGAFSFLKKSIPAWKMYVGIPARPLKARSKKLLKYAPKITKA